VIRVHLPTAERRSLVRVAAARGWKPSGLWGSLTRERECLLKAQERRWKNDAVLCVEVCKFVYGQI